RRSPDCSKGSSCAGGGRARGRYFNPTDESHERLEERHRSIQEKLQAGGVCGNLARRKYLGYLGLRSARSVDRLGSAGEGRSLSKTDRAQAFWWLSLLHVQHRARTREDVGPAPLRGSARAWDLRSRCTESSCTPALSSSARKADGTDAPGRRYRLFS